MTPGARVAATIELIDEIVSQAERPADFVANAYFRQRRFIGGGDRRAVSERAWGILRRWGQLRWWLERARAPELSGRLIVAAELMLAEDAKLADIDALYDGGRYRPAPLDEAEARALRQMEGHSLPHPDQPDWVRLNVQEWVAPHLKEAYGEAWGREIAALDAPPPVDLRVNRLKATLAQARRALARRGHRRRADAAGARRAAPAPPPVGGGRRRLQERPGRDPGRGLAARRRCWSTRGPACRSPTTAPAPAARRWRSPPA